MIGNGYYTGEQETGNRHKYDVVAFRQPNLR